MNILITSAGKRGYLIRYFKAALKGKGKIFAADCSPYAPALYDADDYFLIHPVSDEKYISNLIINCKEKNIVGIVSLNDLELPILSRNRSYFLKHGINIIVSSPEVINICYDKYLTYLFLKDAGFYTPLTFSSINEARANFEKGKLVFPAVIKPRKGSGSIGIMIVNSMGELVEAYNSQENVMIQEYLEGEEYDVDIFNNSNLEAVAAYAKKKIQRRSGETYSATSVYDSEILKYSLALANKMGLYGPADIDYFKQDSRYYILEVNPRFGGCYSLSHALGASFPEMVISLIDNNNITPRKLEYSDNVWMMKQYEIVTKQF
jgi:carbamoyl-phosphate synthase large subunit